MRGNDEEPLEKNYDAVVLCLKFTYDKFKIDDPTKQGAIIPLAKIDQLTKEWRDMMIAEFKFFFDFTGIEDNNLEILRKISWLIDMKLNERDGFVVTESEAGIDVGVGEMVGKDLWFCRKLDEKDKQP
jgi:hypothetical protein